MTTDIIFSPLLPLPLLIALTLLGAVGGILRVRQSLGGTVFRLLTIALLFAFLMGPQRQETEGEVLSDIAVILEDTSRSLEFGNRRAIASDVADRLVADIEAEGVEVRRVRYGDRLSTDLPAALAAGLSDVPRTRLSAVFTVGDGQIHGDLGPAIRGLDVPLHGFITGNPEQERDRRVEVVRAPRFGVVGETVEMAFRLVSDGETGSLPTTLLVNGEVYSQQSLPIGEVLSLGVRLQQPGETIIELDVAPLAGELTPLNNRGVAALTAVRDRLRVLLVSGEPHAGERVWRNILKSDPAVDLVHFTILKPIGKIDTARRDELNLIEFPHEELFLEKLRDFDVVIFDRYTYRGVLLSYEFEEIARYVEAGGAVLIASGPEITDASSLANRPNLSYILPILPDGRAVERQFVPERSVIGARHPITAGLEAPAEWGRWLRYIPGAMRDGQALLTAPNEQPLLVVDRVRDGRIAVLMSDHVWLWARGFDGGGPHQELLRRLVHWLMQEPELEEEALRASITSSGVLEIERRTLSDSVRAVTVTDPEGEATTLTLSQRAEGRFGGDMPAIVPGLYRLQSETGDGETLYALAVSGDEPVRELGAVQTTQALLRPAAAETGGGTWLLRQPGAALPDLRRVRAGGDTVGAGFAGLPRRDIRDIEAIRVSPIMPSYLWALLIAGTALLAWVLESGNLRPPRLTRD